MYDRVRRYMVALQHVTMKATERSDMSATNI